MNSIYHGRETLVTQQKGGIIKQWSIANSGYELSRTENTNHTGFCRLLVDEENGRIFHATNENEIHIKKLNDNDNEILAILDPKSVSVGKKELMSLGYLMCVRCIMFSNQFYILAGYESGVFLTWDLRTNSIINMAQLEEGPCSFDFCSDTNRGIYSNIGDQLRVLSYQKNEMKLVTQGDIPVKNAGGNCIRIRKDQKIFCTGGSDGRVRIFSWRSLRLLTVLTDHRASVNDIVFSDGKVDLWKSPIMATTSNDGRISLWNLYN